MSDEIINCTNLLCNIHKSEPIVYLNEVISCKKIATEICIPKVNSKNNKPNQIIGWGKYVKHYKIKSMLWTDIWKQMGSPSHEVI